MSDIYEHALNHSKKNKKYYKLQNYNKMETNKSVYCEDYFIDSTDLCIYIVDY